MRSLTMLVSLVAAYALLRGYPESWPAAVRACLAVLGLVAGIGIWGKRKRVEGRVVASRRSPGWIDYVAIGAAVLTLECLFLVFFSTVPDTLESAAMRVEEWLRPEVAAARKEEASAQSSAGKGNWLWNDERRRPLPKRTNYKKSNRPEIFLQPTSGADAERMLDSRLYVQAFSLSRYEGAAWSAFPGEEMRLTAENDGWLRMAEGRDGQAVSCRVFQGNEKLGQNPLTGLQGLTAARVESVVSLDSRLQLLPRQEGGYEYDTISKPKTLEDLAGMDPVVPDNIPEVLLDRPGGRLGSKISRQAEIVAGKGGVVEKLKRIRSYLHTLEYSLYSENADDLDPLENFMFYERRGHCELYATAGAMLARSSGIPAKISYGWVGGTYYEGSRLFVFRSREAHAWVEVWLKDYGWVVFDPTPPSAFSGVTPELAGPDEKPPGSEVLEPESEEDLAGGLPVRELGVALSLVFGVPALVMLIWRATRRGREDAWRGGRAGGGGSDGYLHAFVAACGKRGVRVVPGATVRALLGELDETPEFADDLLGYHYGVRYEGRAGDAGVEKQLKRRVEGWE